MHALQESEESFVLAVRQKQKSLERTLKTIVFHHLYFGNVRSNQAREFVYDLVELWLQGLWCRSEPGGGHPK